jgi:hypothetical protein
VPMMPSIPGRLELYNRRDYLYSQALAAIRESDLNAPERIAARMALDDKLWAAETEEQIAALCGEFEDVIRQYKPEQGEPGRGES